MRRLAVPVSWLRLAVGLAVPAALVVTVGGSASAASSPVAVPRAVRGPSATGCTVSWVGKATSPQWTIAKNWSTGKVPGRADDVCVGTGVDVLTPVSITIHSLRLGPEAGIALEGTTANPLVATVATFVDLTGAISRIDLTDATVKAATINDQGGGTIFTDGTCHLSSPDIVFGAGGDVQAANGTTTLTSLPQLSGGTLTGASLSTSGAIVVLPGDITHLVSANISVGVNSEIQDAAGHNALAGLSSVDAQSSLTLDSNLTLTGSSLAADGNVSLNSGVVVAIGGPVTQAQGTLLLGRSTVLSATQVTIGHGATLLGQGGTISANLVNDGSAQAAYGTAQVSGNYTQAVDANLVSGFGGLLAVTGTATLAGSVTASELITHTFDTTQLITFGSLSGGFTSHSLGIRLITKPNEIDAIVLPQITVSPRTVAPGHAVTMTGGGFTYPQTVHVFLDHAGGTPLGTVGVGIRGAFSLPVTIPASATAGHHQIIAIETDGNRASASITVS